jgi:hypothetical protein
MRTHDPTRTLSNKGLHRLQALWLDYWHRNARFEGGNAEQWFHSVLDLLSERGDEVIPRAVRELEERTIGSGRSQEYLAALAEVVQSSPQHNDYDRTVLVLTATPEERMEALARIGQPTEEVSHVVR